MNARPIDTTRFLWLRLGAQTAPAANDEKFAA